MSAYDRFLETMSGKHVTVIGIGVSNTPLSSLLLEAGAHVTVHDRKTTEELGEIYEGLHDIGVEFSVGSEYLNNLSGDYIFRTPGMHPNQPALVKAREQGSIITSEMEVFMQVCPCPILAITGSDGKTTTTTLTCEILKRAGYTCHLGGNIGHPLLADVPFINENDFAVVELSSFQLMDMTCSPAAALVTNVTPNHLDIHKDMAEYVEAKTNIFRHPDDSGLLILNADNALTAGFRGNGTTRFFSRQKEADVCLKDGIICRHGEKVLPVADILIPGVHNVENYMAAIAMVEGLVDDDTIRHVAKTFGGVEHRIELVRVKDGVRFYNDSIASSPSRTIAGLRSFPEKVILIAGGYDKHIPYDVLGPEICAHVKKLFLGGATGEKIRQAVVSCPDYDPQMLEIVDCGTFEPAVRAAAAAAKEGDVVLMSPASAAFDQFKNFMVRGEFYKKLVKEL